jgi:beta-lactam-binding protein with PASTA domain
VPDVLGLTRDEAVARLRDSDFDVDIIEEAESGKGRARKNSGRVWKQSPASGSQAEEGSTVTIWVNP